MIRPISKFKDDVDPVISFLNELVQIDPQAVDALVRNRVPCNAAMADHPTVQCGKRAEGGFEVGMLGVLNGIFGADHDGWGFICVMYEDDGRIRRFERTPPRTQEVNSQ